MPDFTRHAEIEQCLVARGMTPEEVAKICASNWLRVLVAVREGRGQAG
jgi:microsomal dipeptidase-like Zn-dependent dipeptidase